jgi:hypothetical protein
MSRIGRAAARLALRCYPAAWRERYADEVAALVDDVDGGLLDAADLGAGAITEHLNGGTPMRFEPAHRHPRPFALAAAIVLLPTALIVGVSLLGHELGMSAVARAVDPLIAGIDRYRALDLALVVAPAAALILALLPLLDVRLERAPDGGASVAVRMRAIGMNLVVAAFALGVGLLLVGHIVTESVLEAGR